MILVSCFEGITIRQALREPYKQFFGTLANQARIDIIEALRTGEKTVGDISEAANLEQSHVSHNLKRLSECGFVSIEQNGREKTCTLNSETIKPLLELMDNHMNAHCAHVVARKNSQVKKCH